MVRTRKTARMGSWAGINKDPGSPAAGSDNPPPPKMLLTPEKVVEKTTKRKLNELQGSDAEEAEEAREISPMERNILENIDALQEKVEEHKELFFEEINGVSTELIRFGNYLENLQGSTSGEKSSSEDNTLEQRIIARIDRLERRLSEKCYNLLEKQEEIKEELGEIRARLSCLEPAK